MKFKHFFLLLNLLLFSSYLFAQITPNGKSVSSLNGSDLNDTDISAINYIVDNYYDVDVIQSSQANHGRFNCHFYAWNNTQGYGVWTQDYIWKNGQPSPLKWINYPTDYYTDQNYSQPSGYASYVSTTSGEAEICVYTSGGSITHSARRLSYTSKLISKWGAWGIYKHDPDECPDGRMYWDPRDQQWHYSSDYGTITAYYKINPNYRPVGSGDPGGRNWGTISNALVNISSGSAITVFSGTQTLSENITIPSGVTLKINSGATVDLNGYYIKCTGSGKIIKNGTISGYTSYAQSESDYKGFFPSSTTIQQILGWASSGWNITLTSGTYNNSDNLTVNSGITLTINSGVTLRFASGKKLAVNGTLDADNVTFEAQSGTWYGIEFTNASSSSQIWYCTIEDATVGVHMNNTDIYLIGNDINNNTTGLLFNSGSDGVANSNEITYNSSCGIKCTSNSDPLLFTCNIICDNGYGYGGVYGDASSIFDLGRYADQGHNSIYYNDPYEVTTYYSGTIYAKYNWWGDSDPDPNLDYTPPGYIDWSYYLTSDPNTMLAKAISKNPGSDAPIMKAAASTDTIGISEVDYAYLIYRKEAYQTAASLFETIVHKYPNHFSGRRALAFLYKCNKHLNKDSENLTLLDNISTTYANEEIDALAKNIAAGELIKQGDYQAAIARSQAVTNSFAKTEYAKQALFNLGNTYWYFLDDPKTGETYYRQLIAAYPDDDLSISALATLGEWKPDEPKPDQQPQTGNSSPTEFSLDQNYPNPFNPETTIRYHLSEASLVTIRIFNLLGEEVVTLIDGTQLQGNHAIQWNGRDRFDNTVANGVYWLRLQAGKFVRQQKLVVVR